MRGKGEGHAGTKCLVCGGPCSQKMCPTDDMGESYDMCHLQAHKLPLPQHRKIDTDIYNLPSHL